MQASRSSFRFASLVANVILRTMKTKVAIECSGGVVTTVCGSTKSEVTLIDWDDVAEGDLPLELPVAPMNALSAEAREVLAKLYDVDLEREFLATMDGLERKLAGRQP